MFYYYEYKDSSGEGNFFERGPALGTLQWKIYQTYLERNHFIKIFSFSEHHWKKNVVAFYCIHFMERKTTQNILKIIP